MLVSEIRLTWNPWLRRNLSFLRSFALQPGRLCQYAPSHSITSRNFGRYMSMLYFPIHLLGMNFTRRFLRQVCTESSMLVLRRLGHSAVTRWAAKTCCSRSSFERFFQTCFWLIDIFRRLLLDAFFPHHQPRSPRCLRSTQALFNAARCSGDFFFPRRAFDILSLRALEAGPCFIPVWARRIFSNLALRFSGSACAHAFLNFSRWAFVSGPRFRPLRASESFCLVASLRCLPLSAFDIL